MGYVKIWLHIVWTTKNREPLLTDKIRGKVLDHIRENADRKGIYLDTINGHVEHVHCLVSLDSGQTVDKIVGLLKGEASHWVNQNNLTTQKFGWQDKYFAVSLSESALNRVRTYIRNQQEHHRKRTWEEEYREFLSRYGFDRFVSG